MHGAYDTRRAAVYDHMITNGQGQPKALLANVMTMLRLADEWQNVLQFDSFALQTELGAAPPWEAGRNDFAPRPWTSRDDVLATDWLQRIGIGVSVDVVQTAVETVAQDASYHPVQDYLNGLEWDGANRLDKLLPTYFGVEPSAYTHAIGTRFLVSAVARIIQPGCKVDHMPVLEGTQGAGKSTAVKTLAQPWFSDEIADFGSKDAAMQMRSAWFIEISELDAMSRSEVGRVKAFLSRTTDRFRPPYGRRVIEAPRQCVFVGTTNVDTYLRDETGARRFWPVRVGRIDLDALARDRDQIWAEAVHLFKQGQVWWLDDKSLVTQATQVQSQRLVEDPWTEPIAWYLDNVSQGDISVDEILKLVLDMKAERWTQVELNRVARVLRSLGYERYQARRGDTRQWRYRRGG